MIEWKTSCVDWERRIIARESLITFPPLFPECAEAGLSVFKDLHLKDVLGCPTYGEVGGKWQFDFVASIFGSFNPESGRRLIREYFLMVAKKNDKSGMAAGIMMTALILNDRESAELVIIAPTKEIADNSFKPARDMIKTDPELEKIMHCQEHIRTITNRNNDATLKIVAAETDAVGGIKGTYVLIEEDWIFGKRPGAVNMFREATGGLTARPEGFVIKLTTQSDEAPAGVFADDLAYARDVRDGKVDDPSFLPVIYEFPKRMVDEKAYLNKKNWYIPNPNFGASVDEEHLITEQKKAVHKGEQQVQAFLAKHLNIQIATSAKAQNWAGADFWEAAGGTVTLDVILEKSDVIEIGVDGGGLDDLLGLTVIGRVPAAGKGKKRKDCDAFALVKELRELERKMWGVRDGELERLAKEYAKLKKALDDHTREDKSIWLWWSHAWCHAIALKRRKSEAPKYHDFAADGDLTIVDDIGQDVKQFGDIVRKCDATGLLDRIGVDPSGIGAIVDELEQGDENGEGKIDHDRIVGISQGWRLNSAIKTTERKVAAREIIHSGSRMMAWCVGNARAEQKGNAILITKQASGTGKIDPLMAGLSAVALMAMNPEAKQTKSSYENESAEVMTF